MDKYQTELREKLAAIEHTRWADWQKWVHGRLHKADTHWMLGKEQKTAWDRQIKTPYSKLTEAEKNSDREQVDRYWPLIETEIERRVHQAEKQGALNALTQLKIDRIEHTLTTPVAEWKREIDFIDEHILRLMERQK